MSVGRGANLNPPGGRQPRLRPFALRLHLTAQLWCRTHDENILSACHPPDTLPPTSSFLMSSLLPCPTPSPPSYRLPSPTTVRTSASPPPTPQPPPFPSLSHPSPRLAAPSRELRGSHTGRHGGDGVPSLNVKPPAAWTRLPPCPPLRPFLLLSPPALVIYPPRFCSFFHSNASSLCIL